MTGTLARLIAEDGVSVTPLVVMGPTAEMILDAADHLQASHLVVGSHGHGGLHHLLVGSVAEEVVRRAGLLYPAGRDSSNRVGVARPSRETPQHRTRILPDQ